MKRIKITWRDGAYYVSEPCWDGGDVVMATEYDRLAAELDRYKHALWEANGYRIQEGKEPVKLSYPQSCQVGDKP